MTELARRRRALMAKTGGDSQWDSEWYFTDGMPEISGWTRDTTGGTCTIQTDGLRLAGNTFSNIDMTKGIIEAKFKIPNERTDMNNKRAQIRIGDSSKSIYVVFGQYPNGTLKIVILNGNKNLSDWSVCTEIGSWEFGGEYVVKITIYDSVGTVEVNGNVLATNIDTTSIGSKGGLLFGNNESWSSSVWQYVKYKAG